MKNLDTNDKSFRDFVFMQQPLFVLEMQWNNYVQAMGLDTQITDEEIEAFTKRMEDM